MVPGNRLEFLDNTRRLLRCPFDRWVLESSGPDFREDQYARFFPGGLTDGAQCPGRMGPGVRRRCINLQQGQ